MSVATIEGEALARIAFNALAFIPKLAKEQFIRVRINANSIEIAGSDAYTAGKDSAQVHNGPGQPVVFGLDRESLVDLEATARAWKKEALSLSLTPEGLTLQGSGEALTVPLLHAEREAWNVIDQIYAESELAAGPVSGAVAFDPALFGRFGKVKTERDRVADFLFLGPEKPVLVKVGPSFRGLVMPLYREPAEQHVGQDGLW